MSWVEIVWKINWRGGGGESVRHLRVSIIKSGVSNVFAVRAKYRAMDNGPGHALYVA